MSNNKIINFKTEVKSKIRLFIPSINQLFGFFPTKKSPAFISLEEYIKYNKENQFKYEKPYFQKVDTDKLKSLLDNNTEIYLTLQHGENYELERDLEIKIMKELYGDTFIHDYKDRIHFIPLEDIGKFIVHQNNKDGSYDENHPIYLDFVFSDKLQDFLYLNEFLSHLGKLNDSTHLYYVCLTNLNLNYFNDLYYNSLVRKNLILLEQHKGKAPIIDFTCINFLQQVSVYYELEEIIKVNASITKNIITKKQAIDYLMKDKKEVLVFQRSLQRYKDFNKFYFYISDKKLIHKFHLGGDRAEVNAPFDIILCKLGKINDQTVYKDLIQNINSLNLSVNKDKNNDKKIVYITKCNELSIFQDRTLMIDNIKHIIKDFRDEALNKNITNSPKSNSDQSDHSKTSSSSNYDGVIDFPKTISLSKDHFYDYVDFIKNEDVSLKILDEKINNDINDDTLGKFVNYLETILKAQDITFPAMIKIGGYDQNKHHDTWIALNTYGIIEYLIKHPLNKRNILIVQEYIASGNEIIKGYRIAGKDFFYKRKLNLENKINDLLKNNKQEEGQEIDLLGAKDEFVYKKLNNNNTYHHLNSVSKNLYKIENRSIEELTYEHQDGLRETNLDVLMNYFEKKTNINLFGLDFLFDKERNKYYLIDCNFFPGYKELIPEIPNLINEHITKYYSEANCS